MFRLLILDFLRCILFNSFKGPVLFKKKKKNLKKRNCELTQLTNIWLHWISFCISKVTVSSTVDGQSTIFQYLLIFHTEGEGEGGTDWQGSTGVYTRPCIWERAGGKWLCNTGSSAWGCVRTHRAGTEEAGSGGRRCMYTHVVVHRSQHSTVEQLSPN